MEYLNPVFMLLMAAALCIITALIHSVLGEQRLIGPMLASKKPLMESALARNITRFAWHWTTLLWICVAATLAYTAYGNVDAPWLIFCIGTVHLVAGVADAIMTRGQHIGWPLITLIGVLTLLAFYVTTTAAAAT